MGESLRRNMRRCWRTWDCRQRACASFWRNDVMEQLNPKDLDAGLQEIGLGDGSTGHLFRARNRCISHRPSGCWRRRPPTAGPYRSRGKVTFGARKKSMPRWRKSVPRGKRRSRATRRWGPYRASQTMKIEYYKRLVEATPSGMPHWSGTGPPGTVCEQCSFYGYGMQHPNSCHRYFLLTRQHGAPLPISTPSCQHFQPRNMGL